MSLFYIWHPSVDDNKPSTVEFMLTRGDSYGLNRGSPAFVRAVMDAAGLDVEIADWSLTSCRSSYFSDFIGEEDWRDVWQLVWKLSVTTREALGVLPALTEPWIGVDVLDDSWQIAIDDHEALVECLVLADFRKIAVRDRAADVIVGDSAITRRAASLGISVPRFTRTLAYQRYPQLQVQLGRFPGAFFAQGADYAERVIELCRGLKAGVHYTDLL